MAKVHKQEEYDGSAAEMWERIGDFHGLHSWHPGVAACHKLEGGAARELILADGGKIVETQLDSEPSRSYSYRIDESPLPVADYTATLTVREADDGCAVVWTAQFEPSGASEDEAVTVIGGIFDSGLDALKQEEREGSL